jgi:valyl-tRNA synthetase
MTEAAKSKNALKNEAKNKKYLAKMAKLAEEKANPKPKVKKQESVVSQEPEEEWIDRTVPGYKKDLTDPMAAGYKPRQVESSWYSWWEKEGYFEPYLPNGKPSPKGTFVIPIPPPNVTGTLHLGHALTNSIQDCLIRWNRMHGKTVLYNPGCDHAGIATQVVVEKKLMREKGITRHDIGRSAFIDEVMGWKDM